MSPITPDNGDRSDSAKARGDWGEYRRLVMSKLEDLQADQEYIKQHFVSREYFDAMMRPVFRIVYGMVAIIVTAFLTGIIGLIWSGVPQ